MFQRTGFIRNSFKSVLSGTKETPPVSLAQSLIYNPVAQMALKPYCYGRFNDIVSDLRTGAPEALQYLARHISVKDFNAISLCTEESFATKIKAEVQSEDSPHWVIKKVNSCQLKKLKVFLGAIRGDNVPDNRLRSILGLCYVIVDVEGVMAKVGDLPFLEFLNKVRELQTDRLNGVIIQADLLIDVEQSLERENESTENAVHWLKLEMSVVPHSESATEFRPTNNPTEEPKLTVAFEPTDWKIVDLNNFMNGNHPLVSF